MEHTEAVKAAVASGPWYAAKSGTQGLVIDETTGDNIAVTYDKAHAPLVATAPAMYKQLQQSLAVMEAAAKHFQARGEIEMWKKFHEVAMDTYTVLYDAQGE